MQKLCITPVILTLNEAVNIERCLNGLSWAARIVVVDSKSSDSTVEICNMYSNVDVHTRDFDSHANQWNYAINSTNITTDWILALDADYVFTTEAIEWLSQFESPNVCGIRFPFKYAVLGKVLRSGIYPPVIALFRRGRAKYIQDGHTQRIAVDGQVATAPVHLIHDDRKSISSWIQAQGRYARLEAVKLRSGSAGLKASLRTYTPITPLLVAIHCLLFRGGIFEGRAGWRYALERTAAEAMIVVAYLDSRMRGDKDC